jgi:hypothetical protein
VLGVDQAYHYARGSVLLGRKHAAGLGLAAFMAGQLFVRFPYYSLGMLRSGRGKGAIKYLRGLIDGSRVFLRRRQG